MHIPDGFLSPTVIAGTMALSAAGLAVAVSYANRTLPARKVPLLGLSAAFVFAAQMVNFPVAGGTSGHLVGATLVAVLLGPSPAVIVLTAVLLTQCLLFADGGLTALGANTFNMAMVSGVVGYAIYAALKAASAKPAWQLVSAAIAAWVATVLASMACAAQLAASGAAPLSVVLPAMIGWHALIGLGEAAITVMVLSAVTAARPELLRPETVPRTPAFYWSTAAYGALIAVAVALFVSPLASASPDGLERVARDAGFDTREKKTSAALEDYKTPGVTNDAVSKALAGGAGAVLVGAAAVLAFSGVTLMSRRGKSDDGSSGT